MKESELEDLYDFRFYKDLIWNTYSVSLDTPRFKGNKKKWKDRVKEVFEFAGKLWDDNIEMELKGRVAALVVSSPQKALSANKRAAIDNLVAALGARLDALDRGRSHRP